MFLDYSNGINNKQVEIDDFSHGIVQQSFQFEQDLIKGLGSQLFQDDQREKSILEKSISQYNNAKYFIVIDKDFPKAYELLKEALILSKRTDCARLTASIYTDILEMNQEIRSNDKTYASTLNEFENYVQNNRDHFYVDYHRVILNLGKSREDYSNTWNNLFSLARDLDPYYSGLVHELLANQSDGQIANAGEAISAYVQAIERFKSSSNWRSKKRIANVQIRLSMLYLDNEMYKKAVPLLEEAYQTYANDLSALNSKMNILRHLEMLYMELDEQEKVTQTETRIQLIQKQIDSLSYTEGANEGDNNNELAELGKRVRVLEKWRRKYDKNKWWALACMILIFGLSAYSYMRWRKSDQEKGLISEQKSQLEVEHRQTQEEISKIKQLVIKDHIVLKNKAKVLLDELLFIKAEGHYLLLHTLSENEVVRGRLSKLKEELPPNFIRCHRSYIVNQNYISQYRSHDVLLSNDQVVPVSRGYKNNLSG